ncbi:MAG: ABC transporter permease subunit [Planctomycetes bacterium]|nr:ABC transporter permease subunit [Planctomycetota bacterium]MCC7171223.1 ABC transporter permease subunit [Planctomycetota bacterium]
MAVDGVVPLSFLSAALRVGALGPLRLLRGRRLVLVLLLVAVPLIVAGFAWMVRPRVLGVNNFVNFVALFDLSLLLPLVAMLLSAGAIGDDLENGTLLYLRLRPMARAAIIAGRWLGCSIACCVLFVPATIGLYVLQASARHPDLLVDESGVLLAACGIVVLAILAYTALFLVFAVVFFRAMLFGLFLVVGWETAVLILPNKAALYTVGFHSRALMSQATLEGSRVHAIVDPFREVGLLPTVGSSIAGLLVATVVLVAFAGSIFGRKEFLATQKEG